MTRQIAFLAWLLFTSLYAAARGGAPERIAAATLLGGALLSVYVANPFAARFRHVETGLLLVDIAIMGIMLWISVRSTRFWPIWLAALLAAEIGVHLMRLAFPGLIPQAYMDTTSLWSWVAQFLLLAGTWRHRQRRRRTGADVPWKR